jgi:cobalt-zinc-cadmium resistance protein CzcA
VEKDKLASYELLNALLQSESKTSVTLDNLTPNIIFDNTLNKKDLESYFELITQEYKLNNKLQKQYYLPDINLDYFQGKNRRLDCQSFMDGLISFLRVDSACV